MDRYSATLINIGLNVRQIRTGKGLSQTELANLMGKDHPCINRLENGKSNPTTKFMIDLAIALDVEIVELFK